MTEQQQCLDIKSLNCGSNYKKDHEKYQQMIEEKGTAEDSVDLPEEGIECKLQDEKAIIEPSRIGSGKRKICLIIGVIAVTLITIFLGIVATMIGRSFITSAANASNEEPFDFTEVGPDFGHLDEEDPLASTLLKAPSFRPTGTPTYTPTKKVATKLPTAPPTKVNRIPTAVPSPNPTEEPKPLTPAPTGIPTLNPTPQPVTNAPITPPDGTSDTLLTFCVIADVPYNNNEVKELPNQIATQMEGCEFLVHLGDIMTGDDACTDDKYSDVRDMLLASPVPAFIVVGDNEWNDCGNNNQIKAGWNLWEKNFMQIEDNWANHPFNVTRQLGYQENFYFVHKRTLVIGLNIVGGKVHDSGEWITRLSKSHEWVESLVLQNVPSNADGVIVMAHGRPTTDHRHFFNPMRTMMEDVLDNKVPLLYLHGDGHSWIYTPNYYEQSNYLRIQHAGGVRDPILKILADPNKLGPSVTDSFQYDRQLDKFRK